VHNQHVAGAIGPCKTSIPGSNPGGASNQYLREYSAISAISGQTALGFAQLPKSANQRKSLHLRGKSRPS
jgi:hypothetical protein